MSQREMRLWLSPRKTPIPLLELTLDYEAAGLFAEAKGLLSMIQVKNPLIWYHMGHIQCQEGNMEAAEASFCTAEKTDSSYCFPYSPGGYFGTGKEPQSCAPWMPRHGIILEILWYDKSSTVMPFPVWSSRRRWMTRSPQYSGICPLRITNKEQNPQKAERLWRRHTIWMSPTPGC